MEPVEIQTVAALTAAALVLGVLASACAVPPAGSDPAGRRFPEVEGMLAEVSAERVKGTVERLVSFGTRHTLSATDDPERGIGAAREWLRAEMERNAMASGRTGENAVRVSFETHHQEAAGRVFRAVDIVNVVAVVPGSMPEAAGRRYYCVGHYDSRASDGADAAIDAPGANDDASGVAVLVELARVMAKRRHDATLVFLAVAGEEQGLIGSRLHARAAREAGLAVAGVLSDDIVGDPSGLPPGSPLRVRVFSEGIPAAATPEEVRRIRSFAAESDSPSRQLARFVVEVAATHDTGVEPVMVFRPDRFLRGGDHLAFLEQDFPAVRFTDEVEQYHRQHQDVREEGGVRYGDLPEFVDPGHLAAVTRLNGAVLAHLANAPSVPGNPRVIAAELTRETTLRWERSPEPDAAGYEVVWRATTEPTWTHARDAGDTTEITLPVPKDDFLFGVRAYDREGYRSPVGFAAAARE